MEKSKEIKKEVSDLMEIGKELIRNANIDIGLDNFIKNVTLMGTEIPSAVHKQEIIKRNYGFYNTSNTVDEALFIFNKIQEKLIELAIIENTILRLEKSIEKVRTRSNALQNIVIPENEKQLKDIADKLDERDREEFARLKVVKKKIE